MKPISSPFILVFILLVLSSCHPKQVDENILGTELCSPPCWRGIIPGTTTKTEVVETLAQWKLDGTGTWSELPEDIRWLDNNGERYKYLHVKDDIIQYIRFEVDATKLQYVIDNYGSPDSISIHQCVDCLGYGISLNYPNSGLIFMAESQRMSEMKRLFMDEYEITPEMNVNSVYFLAPSDISTMFQIFCETEECVNRELQRLHAWPGFGVFKDE